MQEQQHDATPDPSVAEGEGTDDDASLESTSHLDPDEAADIAETHDEAAEAKGNTEEEDRQDEDIISLDVPD